MTSARAPLGPTRTRLWSIALLVLVAVIMLIPPAQARSHPAAAMDPLGVGTSLTAGASPSGAHPLAPVRPTVVLSGTYFQNVSNFSAVPQLAHRCGPYFYSPCYDQAVSPSLVRLANGSLGIGFAQVTKATTSSCLSAPGNTSIRVGFSISKDGGKTFSVPLNLGNNTCPYVQSLEPSFAVGSQGKIFDAFVEANDSLTSFIPYYGAPILPYATRPQDALALQTSTDNGTSFTAARTLVAGGNIARPAVATFGKSVYIVYENISNGTSILPGALSSTPIAIDLVYSTDNGATWNGPYNLPGQNATAFDNAMSPSIAVSANGTVVVAYATARSCLGWCSSTITYLQTYGENITIATSLTNGTSFKGPRLVAPYIGESPQYQSSYAPALFGWAPQTAIAINPASSAIYVTWSGGYNRSAGGSYAAYSDWDSTEVHVAVSTNGGSTWTDTRVSQPLPNDPSYSMIESFNPGIGVAPNGTVDLTYGNSNQSSACGYTHYLSPAYWQTIQRSSNGILWGSPVITAASTGTYGYLNYDGYTSSVAFNASGYPIAAYALPTTPYYFSGVATTALQVAAAFSGAATSVTFHENGLTATTRWSFSVQGNVFSTTLNSLTLSVPKGVPLLVENAGPVLAPGYASVLEPVISQGEATTFTGPTTDYFNFTTFYGVQFAIEPNNLPYFSMYIVNTSVGYNFNWYFGNGITYHYSGGCPFLWYMPAGTHLSFTLGYPTGSSGAFLYSSIPIAFWNGTGSSSYTGSTTYLNLTVNSPINETGWAEPWGKYPVKFGALGLPSTSRFQFSLDGVSYSANATSILTVPNVTTGPHWLSAISANSSVSGWEYFGSSLGGNPVLVPNQLTDNFTFAFVHIAAPVGTVSFHASGFTTGTVWRFAFNGTTYSSSTPWINVSTHPGVYAVAAYPAVAQNGSVGFTPTGVTPTMTVISGATYTISYTQAYKVTSVAGLGGSVTPSGSYWIPRGGNATFVAKVTQPGFVFGGWSGTGPGSFTGGGWDANVTPLGPVTEAASFYPLVPNRFNLTFVQTSIPTGTWWTVDLNGVGYSSNTSTLVVPQLYSCAFSGNLGKYSVFVPYAYTNGTSLARYVPAAYRNVQCGGSPTVTLTFTPQYYFDLQSTAGGVATAQAGALLEYGSFWVGASSVVTLQATPDAGYSFLSWNGTGSGSYTGGLYTQPLTAGGPITELAVFALTPGSGLGRFHLTFTLALSAGSASSFATGTVWSVQVASANYSSSSNTLEVDNLATGSFTIKVAVATAPGGMTEYQPVAPPASVPVNGNTTQLLTFQTFDWVSITSVGPGVAGPHSGWQAEGSTFHLSAVPTGANLFVGWVGSGNAAYSGPDPNGSVTVRGPVTEVASFLGPNAATKSVTSSWSSPTLLAGLAIAGLIVGLVAGFAAMRLRRGGRAPPAPAAEAPGEPMPVSEEAPMEEGT